ncbi:MAG: DUF7844 domain-containing protein [Bdellovibrio sp.]
MNVLKNHRKNKFCIFISMFAFCFSLKAMALTIEVSPRNLTVRELISVNSFVIKAMDVLPPLVKEKIQAKLKLEFQNLGKEGRWGEAQHKFLNEKTIVLDRSLLPAIVAGNENSLKNNKWATKLRSLNDIALGTILHEIAHFFDDWGGSPISETNEFLHLNYFKNSSEKSTNTLAAKSPNWYEFKSSSEAFAVNFEFYLLDPDFKCRKPLLYDYFANKIFKHVPHPNAVCSMVTKVFETGNILESAQSQYVDLDFKNLYQAHYLLADKGSELSSKWGHAMIRLVFCDPERIKKGPECLKDLAYHKVISFRAIPNTDTVSLLKGLTGKYPSFLFVLPFTQVIHDYTVDELRPVKSVPLRLTDEQLKKLLLRTLEIHWSYRGKYYFINNNCAVETLNLIRTVLPELPSLENRNAVTPQGVLQILSQSGVADNSAFYDLKYAWKQGFYYYPNDKIPNLAYSKLKTGTGQLDKISLKEFLFDMDGEKRNQIYKEIFDQELTSRAELNEFYSSALYLEKQIAKNLIKKSYNEAMLKLVENTEGEQNQTGAITWTESWYYGYGIPTEKDFKDYYIIPNERKQLQQKAYADSLKEKIETLWDKELKKQLSITQDNLNFIVMSYNKNILKFKN